MTESVLNFGPGACLVGILSHPAVRRRPDLAVILLNSGIIHRAGPNRIHVRLARKLAEAGILSFRIDMAGIGDSTGLGTIESADEECLLSVGAALDVLEAQGLAQRFVLFGLCSGAEYGFQYASRDSRVVGLVGVDPPTLVRSRKYYLVRMLEAVRRPVVWYRFLTGHYRLMARLVRRLSGGDEGQPARKEARRWASRALAQLVERDVRLLLIITRTGKQLYNYEAQLLDIFPRIGLEKVLRVLLFPEAGHTFSGEVHKRALESELLKWLEQAPFIQESTPTSYPAMQPSIPPPAWP